VVKVVIFDLGIIILTTRAIDDRLIVALIIRAADIFTEVVNLIF